MFCHLNAFNMKLQQYERFALAVTQYIILSRNVPTDAHFVILKIQRYCNTFISGPLAQITSDRQ